MRMSGSSATMNRRKGNAHSDRHLEASDFQVIGELRGDPGHLLLMCGDGHWYDYDLTSGEIARIAPSDSWAVDVIDNASESVELERERIAP